jgi:tetratricopeptide (TPR) repeat protein
MRAPAAIAILFAFGASGVRADDSVWDRATLDVDIESARFDYQRHLEAGDEDVQLAVTNGELRSKRRHVMNALASYRAAINAMPDEPEAHYRLGVAEYTFMLACETVHASTALLCDPDNPDPAVMQDVVDHWHKFTELAPLDNRGNALLFPRAILHTKLATKEHFQLAIADYEAILDRREGAQIGATDDTTLSNLAETYMMVDRLDDAIGTYERAAAIGADTSTMYGLAVALDRDGQGTRARQIISQQGTEAFEQFQDSVAKGRTFFVPDGEQYYYLALVNEALGLKQQAIIHYDLFLRSGAHPQYQARAKHNRDAIRAKLPNRDK